VPRPDNHNTGTMDDDAQEQTKTMYQKMALCTFGFFARIVIITV
jgi:hypothetical protein